MDVSLEFEKPVIFGVLTVNTLRQAKDRITKGKRGDKGIEIAQASINMINQK